MLTKTEAEKCLSPYLEKLKQCLDGGWEAWQAHYSHRHGILSPRARAAIVYDEIINLAKIRFTEPGVKITRSKSIYVLYIGDDVVLRFKKLRNGVPSNISTDQQKLFEGQQEIPGILPGTYVSAGYELDELQQRIERSLIVARLNGRPVWTLSLDMGLNSLGQIEIMPTPAAPSAAPARVRLRKEVSEGRKRKANSKNSG